jgi:hypothetical protein
MGLSLPRVALEHFLEGQGNVGVSGAISQIVRASLMVQAVPAL